MHPLRQRKDCEMNRELIWKKQKGLWEANGISGFIYQIFPYESSCGATSFICHIIGKNNCHIAQEGFRYLISAKLNCENHHSAICDAIEDAIKQYQTTPFSS